MENVDESIITQDISVVEENSISITNNNDKNYTVQNVDQLNNEKSVDEQNIGNNFTTQYSMENYTSLTIQNGVKNDDGYHKIDSHKNVDINSISIMDQSQNSQQIEGNVMNDNKYNYLNSMTSQSSMDYDFGHNYETNIDSGNIDEVNSRAPFKGNVYFNI